MSDQLPLFDTTPEAPPDPWATQLAAMHAAAAPLRAALPPQLHFGTSSWSFPGWKGLVYGGARSATTLAREGLAEYARHPLLTTVGVDRSYYAPVPMDDWRRYAGQLPSGFRCCIKAPASVTAPWIGAPGERPVPNPDFLSPARLADELLEPLSAVFADHAGPIILEIAPPPRGEGLPPDRFHRRLDDLLAALPGAFRFVVELRDRRLLTAAYTDILHAHGVGHTYNYWSAMPMPGAQAEVVPPETGALAVVRLLLRPGTWYEEQRDRFRPFDRLVEPDRAMREDVEAVVARAVGGGRDTFVLVNNKAEGSSPLTIMALAERIAARLRRVRHGEPPDPAGS
ncbi:MAG: DUF72 domain-containing protein [Vicinamibacterales bacterium]